MERRRHLEYFALPRFFSSFLFSSYPSCSRVPAPAYRTAIAAEPRAHSLQLFKRNFPALLLPPRRALDVSSFLPRTVTSFLSLASLRAPLRDGAPALKRSRKPHPRHRTDVVPRFVTRHLGNSPPLWPLEKSSSKTSSLDRGQTCAPTCGARGTAYHRAKRQGRRG